MTCLPPELRQLLTFRVAFRSYERLKELDKASQEKVDTFLRIDLTHSNFVAVLKVVSGSLDAVGGSFSLAARKHDTIPHVPR